jgi:hypothetical protein
VSNRIIYREFWDADELYGMWEWDDDEWSGSDEL